MIWLLGFCLVIILLAWFSCFAIWWFCVVCYWLRLFLVLCCLLDIVSVDLRMFMLFCSGCLMLVFAVFDCVAFPVCCVYCCEFVLLLDLL